MNNSNTVSHNKNNSALAYAWGQYRVYAHTSRNRKAKLTSWRRWVLILGIAGAFFGVLCQQAIQFEFDQTIWEKLPTFLGSLSALAFGLATYFGKELISPEQEREWIRARSIAESLKTEVYKFLTNTTPYSSADNAKQLLKETEKLLESVKDLPYESLSEEEKLKGLPSDIFTTADYIKKRVDDQINGFYRPRAKEFTAKMKNIKHFGLVLGIIIVVFGALGATTGWTAGWIAFLTTVTASIAAYAYSGRYQYLIISYQATANRLELLRARWQASGLSDTDLEQRNQFILDCEITISIENSAWMAELTKEKGEGMVSKP